MKAKQSPVNIKRPATCLGCGNYIAGGGCTCPPATRHLSGVTTDPSLRLHDKDGNFVGRTGVTVIRKTLAFLLDQAMERRMAFQADCAKLGVDASRAAAAIYRAGEPETHLKTKRKRVSRRRNKVIRFLGRNADLGEQQQ